MIQSRSDDRIIYIIIRTVDQRPKLYALRTTWDDVFEPRILYDLDIKVNISIFIMTTHDYDPKILLFILYESCTSFRSKLLIAIGQ